MYLSLSLYIYIYIYILYITCAAFGPERQPARVPAPGPHPRVGAAEEVVVVEAAPEIGGVLPTEIPLPRIARPASNCSTGNCLSSFDTRISTKGSN